jgi:hypothetical protein
MSTVAVYNAFGGYDERDGERGVFLYYAGTPFWFPFKRVAYLPNWTFRELDHDKSTAKQGEVVPMTYTEVRVSGQRLSEELLRKEIPYPPVEMGIVPITGEPTGRTLHIPAGTGAELDPNTNKPEQLWADVAEVQPTFQEVAKAEAAAKRYKEKMIAEYFQSKRQRMAGGAGHLHPPDRIQLYMNELGVTDIDDVGNHALKGGMDPETMATAMALAMELMRQKAEQQLEEATRPSSL